MSLALESARNSRWFPLHEFLHGIVAPGFLFLSGFLFAYTLVEKPKSPDLFFNKISSAFGLFAVVLMGAAVMSLGLFISAISRNQITSGTLTFGICLLLYIFGSVGEKMPTGNPAPETWPGALRDAAGLVYNVFRQLVLEMPLDTHAREMALGILQPKDIAYYVLFSAFFLFLTFRALESRQWRG